MNYISLRVIKDRGRFSAGEGLHHASANSNAAGTRYALLDAFSNPYNSKLTPKRRKPAPKFRPQAEL